jgi:hypothetical protein
MHTYEINANPNQTPPSPEGPLALPGVYTLTLTVDGKSYKQTVTVRNDPRSPANGAALRAQSELQVKLYDAVKQAWDDYHEIQSLRDEIKQSVSKSAPADVMKASSDLDAKLVALAGTAGGGRGGFFGRPGGAPPKPTFVMANGALARDLTTMDSGDMAPNEAIRNASEGACKDLKDLIAQWQAIRAKDLPTFNALLEKNHLKTLDAL